MEVAQLISKGSTWRGLLSWISNTSSSSTRGSSKGVSSICTTGHRPIWFSSDYLLSGGKSMTEIGVR